MPKRTTREKTAAAADATHHGDKQLPTKGKSSGVTNNHENNTANDGENIQLLLSRATDKGPMQHHLGMPELPQINIDDLDERKPAAVDNSQQNNGQQNNDTSKKRSRKDAQASGKQKQQRKEVKKFIDLSDVPEQSPILRTTNRKGSSQYEGVSFDKKSQKWRANIKIGAKQHCIGEYGNEEEAGKDYARAVYKYRGGESAVERQQQRLKAIDLRDVPDQLPLLNSSGRGSSKYQGVSFDKARKRWQAQIKVEGKNQTIGYYENEEEAGRDFARAVYKYRGGEAAVERQQQQLQQKFIDLKDVPEQLPIRRSNGKSGYSEYKGVSFDKVRQKWQAHIHVDGKKHAIGTYENEEAAAVDYARALFKYQPGKSMVERQKMQMQKGEPAATTPKKRTLPLKSAEDDGMIGESMVEDQQMQMQFPEVALAATQQTKNTPQKRSLSLEDSGDSGKKRSRREGQKAIDLTDAPADQLPMLKNKESGSSKYKGVSFNATKQKWQAHIVIEGKIHHIGDYDNKEAANVDYARAESKYRPVSQVPRLMDLSDVPEQLPMLKKNGMSGTSKYQGVSFSSSKKKWVAQIMFDGKNKPIGVYDDEEEAAKDYARAVYKYRGGKAAIERQQQKLVIDLISEVAPAAGQQTKNAPQKSSLPLKSAEDNGKRPRPNPRQKPIDATDVSDTCTQPAPHTSRLMDLSDVPEQLPMLKKNGMSGTSKYQGVSFSSTKEKWVAQIMFDGKNKPIGVYDDEEEAAKDYARAVYKYRGGKAAIERQQQKLVIDLSDVPDQQPILKRNGKSGTSKYQGVSFNTACKKWDAYVRIDGKSHTIGYYDNEEEAGKAHARAVYKYRGGKAAVERRQQERELIDLSDIPDQLPILKSNGKTGTSKYQGVTFSKACQKWEAYIQIDGKQRTIGLYENEEEAAKDYARALVKYQGRKSSVERQRRQQQKLVIDLSDIPDQLPILKTNGKSGTSKYQGVCFLKTDKKWQARITIDGRQRHIGCYDNEEQAAKDYARAVVKYQGGQTKVGPIATL